jgi:hypothetical protein
VDILAECEVDGFRPVCGFGDHLKVWFGVDHVLESLADEGVVVGDEDPGHERDGHHSGCLRRYLESYLDATVGPLLDRNRPADDQCPLADTAQAAALDVPRVEALAVVDHLQDDAALAALEREPHFACLRVAGNVREAFLRDPVEDELCLRVEGR